MAKHLINRIGRGIAPLVLTGALALGACASGTQVDGLKGGDMNPAKAKPFSELDIPTQVEYFFKVPVRETKPGNLMGLTETKDGYRVVVCVPYNQMADTLTDAKARDAVLEAMTGKKSYRGIVDNLWPYRSRRIDNIFCRGYTVNKSDIHTGKIK